MYRHGAFITAFVLLGCSIEKPIAPPPPTVVSSSNNKVAFEYEMQRKCSADAKAFFDYVEIGSPSKATDDLSNHYNTNLNRCFALVTHGITSVNDIYTKTLFDAIGRKEYASYAWVNRSNKKYWDVPPLECKLQGNPCSSEEEFDKWVKPYMSD